jgi:Tol biopolymer transport system component
MRISLLALALAVSVVACGAAATTDATGGGETPSVANVVPAVLGWRLNSDGTTGTIATVNTDGGNYRVIAASTLSDGSAQSANGGRYYVYSDGTDPSAGRLMIIDNGAKRTLVAPSSLIASASAPMFSPDNQYVYFRAVTVARPTMTNIWRVKLDGSGLAAVGLARPNAIGAPTVSPDGRTLLETTSDSVIFTIVSSGATHGERVHCPSAQYAPDGLHVSCVFDGDLVVYDAQFTQTPRYLGDGTYTESGGTDWTPDGTKILVTSTTKGPELVNYATGSVISANLGSSYKFGAFVH